MQHAYSWQGSRLHLVLEEDVADAHNRAHRAFKYAQIMHEQFHGQKWIPTEPLLIDWTAEESKAFDDIAKLINLLIEINGGGLDIPEEECTHAPYLIKL